MSKKSFIKKVLRNGIIKVLKIQRLHLMYFKKEYEKAYADKGGKKWKGSV